MNENIGISMIKYPRHNATVIQTAVCIRAERVFHTAHTRARAHTPPHEAPRVLNTRDQ